MEAHHDAPPPAPAPSAPWQQQLTNAFPPPAAGPPPGWQPAPQWSLSSSAYPPWMIGSPPTVGGHSLPPSPMAAPAGFSSPVTPPFYPHQPPLPAADTSRVAFTQSGVLTVPLRVAEWQDSNEFLPPNAVPAAAVLSGPSSPTAADPIWQRSRRTVNHPQHQSHFGDSSWTPVERRLSQIRGGGQRGRGIVGPGGQSPGPLSDDETDRELSKGRAAYPRRQDTWGADREKSDAGAARRGLTGNRREAGARAEPGAPVAVRSGLLHALRKKAKAQRQPMLFEGGLTGPRRGAYRSLSEMASLYTALEPQDHGDVISLLLSCRRLEKQIDQQQVVIDLLEHDLRQAQDTLKLPPELKTNLALAGTGAKPPSDLGKALDANADLPLFVRGKVVLEQQQRQSAAEKHSNDLAASSNMKTPLAVKVSAATSPRLSMAGGAGGPGGVGGGAGGPSKSPAAPAAVKPLGAPTGGSKLAGPTKAGDGRVNPVPRPTTFGKDASLKVAGEPPKVAGLAGPAPSFKGPPSPKGVPAEKKGAPLLKKAPAFG